MEENPIEKLNKQLWRDEALKILVPGIENSVFFNILKTLPEEVQVNIVEYIREQKKNDIRGQELIGKVVNLIIKSKEMVDMKTDQNSDRKFIPKENPIQTAERQEAEAVGNARGTAIYNNNTKLKTD